MGNADDFFKTIIDVRQLERAQRDLWVRRIVWCNGAHF